VGNTFDSHRAIYLASLVGKEDAMVEELFKNYFSEQKVRKLHLARDNNATPHLGNDLEGCIYG